MGKSHRPRYDFVVFKRKSEKESGIKHDKFCYKMGSGFKIPNSIYRRNWENGSFTTRRNFKGDYRSELRNRAMISK